MSISLTATGFEQLERRLSADRFAAAMRRGLAEGARVIKRELVAATPRKSGKTARAWRSRVVGDDRVEFSNDSPVLRYIVGGTRPHIIRPRRGKALAFSAGGQRIITKLVHHPGNKPNDFPSRVLRDGQDRVVRVMRAEITSWLEGH